MMRAEGNESAGHAPPHTWEATMATLTFTAAHIVAALAAASDAEHAAIRAALKARVTPEQAAANTAYVTKGFACTAGCNRTGFRTAARAAKHGDTSVVGGGHTPAVA